MDKKYSKKLIELRGDKTKEQVSRDLNISISALLAYEDEERIPRDEVKFRIANYYNTSMQNIFN